VGKRETGTGGGGGFQKIAAIGHAAEAGDRVEERRLAPNLRLPLQGRNAFGALGGDEDEDCPVCM
jgi:hypothetical protein